MRAVLPSVLLIALAGAAEAGMSAAEFEAYTTGRTLTYAENGRVYGIEEYRQNRRVRWAFIGDTCREGYWYEAGEDICFVYDHDPEPQCWRFERGRGGLIATFMGADDGRELYEAEQSDTPLICLGPDIGA